ncbi:MAG TPA: S53 family peptidase [Crenalkalicoccus sp.]|jgi:kumamolisin|nr:S53 family peptidase [Crenalkalicoccus sp.]
MSERKVFHDSIIPLPDQPGPTPNGLIVHAAARPAASETMTLFFSLAPPADAQKELEARVARGEIVPPAELASKYGVRDQDAATLEAWLRDHGFEILGRSQGNLGVYARGTVARIEEALQVHMARVTKRGATYTAARDAPSLPVEVAGGVNAILGLQQFRQAHKHAIKRPPKDGNRSELREEHEGAHDVGPALGKAAAGPSRNTANAPPYLVSEIVKAYGADGLGVTGAGQTIAILIDTFPVASDLRAFSQRNGIPDLSTRVEKVAVGQGHLPVAEGEETLDACWAGGVAPGAKVRIYASGSLQFVALDQALDRILADVESQPGMRQLSISLGLGETFMGGPSGEVAVQHQKFLRLAAAGVNVFVSSGDAGSNPGTSGQDSDGPLQVEFGASDPFVIGVGGTKLVLGSDGAVAQETAWTGSGGGMSVLFDRPAFQAEVSVPQGERKRLVPDVSLAAAPEEGALLVLHGRVTQIGGTSWSAPVWAGFCALINEARAKAGKPPLPFLNPLLYELRGTACFRDIVEGSNGAFSAGEGYDPVTGCGVPNLRELMRRLTSDVPTA